MKQGITELQIFALSTGMTHGHMLLLIFTVATIVFGRVEGTYSDHYCGQRLADTLESICNSVVKRNEKHVAVYHKRSIVKECCETRCGIQTLLSYCDTNNEASADTVNNLLRVTESPTTTPSLLRPTGSREYRLRLFENSSNGRRLSNLPDRSGSIRRNRFRHRSRYNRFMNGLFRVRPLTTRRRSSSSRNMGVFPRYNRYIHRFSPFVA